MWEHWVIDVQGSHSTWKTLKTWNFVIFSSRLGKCLEFVQKGVKPGILTQNLGKNLKFANSMFQASLCKMSFTKIILIYIFVISTLSTQTLIRSQIDLGFPLLLPGNNLENTWSFMSQEKWEPWMLQN